MESGKLKMENDLIMRSLEKIVNSQLSIKKNENIKIFIEKGV